MMSVVRFRSEIINDSASLQRVLGQWWQLWRQCRLATPFQSPAWLWSWWQTFAPGELYVVAVRSGGQLVGLAPCYLETARQQRRVLPLGIPISDYLDVLMAPELAEAVAAPLVASLAAGREWDVCEFTELKPQAQAIGLPCPRGYCDAGGPAESCPVLRLPQSSQGLGQLVPAGMRRDVRQAVNRMARRGAVRVVRARPKDAETVLAQLVRLHQARWHGRGGGVLGDARVIRFHQYAIADLFEQNLLRCYWLEVAGTVAAIYYGFMHANVAYAYLGGFDPVFAYESPGTILLDHAIREAVREGAGEFHFLRGREAYKFKWGATDRWNRWRTLKRADAQNR
jgi:CelD/BcsL family acetyltransferase involved in cellulose biosynthesis